MAAIYALGQEYKTVGVEKHEAKIRKRHRLEDDEEITLRVPKLAKEIARRITGPHNQDYRMIVVGAFGKGKSTFCLYLGHRVAEEVAKLKGGTAEDYFNRENIAIAEESEIQRALSNLKKWNIYLLDDVGKAWGAREFMSRLNKLFNDIFQLMRTANTFLLISIASTFLVDKVPRNLVNSMAEMDDPLFDYGLTLVKVKNVKHRPQYGDVHMPFPVFGPIKVVRYLGKLPPEDLMAQYVKEREAVEIKLREQRDKEKEAAEEPKQSKRDQKRSKKDVEFAIAHRLITEKGLEQKEACELAGISDHYYREVMSKYEV
jgi:hypothetical protein